MIGRCGTAPCRPGVPIFRCRARTARFGSRRCRSGHQGCSRPRLPARPPLHAPFLRPAPSPIRSAPSPLPAPVRASWVPRSRGSGACNRTPPGACPRGTRTGDGNRATRGWAHRWRVSRERHRAPAPHNARPPLAPASSYANASRARHGTSRTGDPDPRSGVFRRAHGAAPSTPETICHAPAPTGTDSPWADRAPTSGHRRDRPPWKRFARGHPRSSP